LESLRGVRLAQATKGAQLSAEDAAQALQHVANRYSVLMELRRRERLAQRDTQIKDKEIGR
jgi:hypothetical protein